MKINNKNAVWIMLNQIISLKNQMTSVDVVLLSDSNAGSYFFDGKVFASKC